jgi:hypothetical protein
MPIFGHEGVLDMAIIRPYKACHCDRRKELGLILCPILIVGNLVHVTNVGSSGVPYLR